MVNKPLIRPAISGGGTLQHQRRCRNFVNGVLERERLIAEQEEVGEIR